LKLICKYFYLQTINFWKDLSLRLQLEIIFLLIVYFSFFTGRLIDYSNELLKNPDISPEGLVLFLLHVFILIVSITMPFIHLNLIPKQKYLTVFRTVPLNLSNSFILLVFYHLKYQIISLILIVPFYVALIFNTGIFISSFFPIFLLLYMLLFIFLITFFTVKNKSGFKIVFQYFFVIFSFNLIFAFFYLKTDYFIYFDLIVIPGAFTLLFKWWAKNWENWDVFLNRNINSDKTGSSYKIKYDNLLKFVPDSVYPFFAKELLNQVRNKKYVRLQIVLIVIFLMLLVLITINVENDFVIYATVLTVILIWQHYSLQFNEKYVKADSRFFMKTLPFKYSQIWLSKFITEYIFVIIVQLILLCSFLIRKLTLSEILQTLALVNLFSTIVLIMIINFKITFYDQPRFAGYAYHFFVIFTTVMIINYWLVGPMITIFLIVYFTFSSYKEFAK